MGGTGSRATRTDEILPGLFLSGVDVALDEILLRKNHIQAVCICCRPSEGPDRKDGLPFYRVDVVDSSREPVELFFQEAVEFVSAHRSADEGVLVHCRSGVSRSATIVLAYLLTEAGMPLLDAFHLVRSKRPVVTPNIGFMRKLIELEISISSSQPSLDLRKYADWYTADSNARPAVPDLHL